MWKFLPISLFAATLLLKLPVLQIREIRVLYSHLSWQYQMDGANLSSIMVGTDRSLLLPA